MNILIKSIVPSTSVDGLGWRTSIYCTGCWHRCTGCHNPETWNLASGNPVSTDRLIESLRQTGHDLTLTGGDPMYQARACLELVRKAKERLGINVWLYTGFTWEELQSNPYRRELAHAVDVIVDGPFEIAHKTSNLPFRGSSNQRIIDVKATLMNGRVTELAIDNAPRFDI